MTKAQQRKYATKHRLAVSGVRDQAKNISSCDARKKQYGEIFTPPDLVNEMLDKIPGFERNPDKKTVMDPACGNGNFLIEALDRKLKTGCKPSLCLATIFGMDILPDNVLACRQRLLEVAGSCDPISLIIVSRNIRCDDALKADTTDPEYWALPQWLPKLNDIAPHNATLVAEHFALCKRTGILDLEYMALYHGVKKTEIGNRHQRKLLAESTRQGYRARFYESMTHIEGAPHRVSSS
jgi:hypothetical protein